MYRYTPFHQPPSCPHCNPTACPHLTSKRPCQESLSETVYINWLLACLLSPSSQSTFPASPKRYMRTAHVLPSSPLLQNELRAHKCLVLSSRKPCSVLHEHLFSQNPQIQKSMSSCSCFKICPLNSLESEILLPMLSIPKIVQ
jgi:hypothetical protein